MKAPTTWAALLRAINVGGNNVIPMADLRAALTKAGLDDVRTLLASGNVVFRSRLGRAQLERSIDAALQKAFGYEARLVLKTTPELAALVEGAPKGFGRGTERRWYVMFLRPEVDAPGVLGELTPKAGVETLTYHPGALLWAPQVDAIARSGLAKLSSHRLYRQLTIRNWNTTTKLLALMRQAEAG